ncbi:Cof-type HAD-IIB family hydrolase [Alkaliphilus peptidifermentans]|uniref:Cof subfamily of IIB subfamily of haloacid dehalogenase superfamily/HAD-superfamily hydrolase, subfamily IIB n=1 Tax=Alkaliphilus peptidifermentans DSM 18978 TaxID=1120976 RepID=A0A1G5K1Q6_9FIRM|nr:Cof-type HAD-IIB family hydrolase [Alkaliphilus peptidifermentans]SCY94602.1 hypothetical protein SAMN03080606_03187 [Alkaliphilus peptidifermentans DSM 18978]
MYKLVVLDMDGTLLNSENEVSQENKNALKKVQEVGIKVAIATGRIFTSARFYAEILGIQTPIIACNGALIRNYHDNKVLYSNSIDLEDALKIIEICRKNDIYFHFYDQEKLYVDRQKINYLDTYYWKGRKRINEVIHIEPLDDVVSFITNNNLEILKFVIVDEDREKLETLRKDFNSIQNIEVDKSWYNNLEIMNQGVSKGRAISKLAGVMDIKREEIIAFGDNYNDLSMKDHVAAFVAMGNSEEEVKNKADYLTDSNDQHGVARGIEKLVL